MLKNINLQWLAEPSAADPGTGGGQSPAEPSTSTASVTFTAEQLAAINKIDTVRSERATRSALTSYFQQQGMTEEQATEAIKAYKEAKAKELPASAAEAVAAANKRADEALSAANQILVKADARLQAASIGARTDRIDTILAMAKLDGVKVADGSVDSAAVKAALEAVVKQFPEWKNTEPPPGFQVGSSGNTSTGADDAALRRAFGLPEKK